MNDPLMIDAHEILEVEVILFSSMNVTLVSGLNIEAC
jgi:hypothetical protein